MVTLTLSSSSRRVTFSFIRLAQWNPLFAEHLTECSFRNAVLEPLWTPFSWCSWDFICSLIIEFSLKIITWRKCSYPRSVYHIPHPHSSRLQDWSWEFSNWFFPSPCVSSKEILWKCSRPIMLDWASCNLLSADQCITPSTFTEELSLKTSAHKNPNCDPWFSENT